MKVTNWFKSSQKSKPKEYQSSIKYVALDGEDVLIVVMADHVDKTKYREIVLTLTQREGRNLLTQLQMAVKPIISEK